MEFNYTNAQIEEIVNWTLPGLTMYYRDSELRESVFSKYKKGDIFRAQTFVDVSSFAGKLTKNCRFIIASSKAAPLYKMNPATEKWQLHTINANSYFKVLDIYEKEGKRQFFLLHIPARAIDFFRNTVLNLGGNNIEEQIITKARASLDQKMQMEPITELEEAEWIHRTEFPVGLDNNNEFFPLIPTEELNAAAKPLSSAIYKITSDTELNIPVIQPGTNVKKDGGFWKKLFGQ